MKTKLTRIKYYKYTGDPVAAGVSLGNEPGIKVDSEGGDLIVRMNDDPAKFIRVKRGLNVVGIASPQTMGYVYYRMSDVQLNQYADIANRSGQLVLD